MTRAPTPPGPPPRPGEYSFCAEDDEPTRPDGIADVSLAAISAVYRSLDPTSRRRMRKVVEAWAGMTIEQRVLVEHLMGELAAR